MAIPEMSRPSSATALMVRTSLALSRRSGWMRTAWRSRSVLGERIADPSHRPDVARLGGIRLDLVADVADVDVDGALVRFERVVVVADELEQLGAGEDAARLGGEVAEQVELRRGEVDPLPVARDAPALEVDDEVAAAQGAAAPDLGQLAVGATELRLHAAHELADAERLHQVVVGTDLEADHLVDLVGARGEEDDRCPGVAAEAAACLEAVDPRQSHVEEDDLRRERGVALERLLAGPDDGDAIPFAFEGDLDAAGDRGLVLDDHDRSGHRGR